MARGHAWEQPHAWDDCGFWGCPDSDSDFEEERPSAGMAFVEYVVNLATARDINDTQCCSLMYYAFAAGIVEAKPYMLRPGAHEILFCNSELGQQTPAPTSPLTPSLDSPLKFVDVGAFHFQALFSSR